MRVVYDRPFQWGSKRTGPDLARVGGKYSDDWHRDHLKAPKSVVPGTVMPAYPWLFKTAIDPASVPPRLRAMQRLPRVCRHLHLPVQSGSDRILKAMTDATLLRRFGEPEEVAATTVAC